MKKERSFKIIFYLTGFGYFLFFLPSKVSAFCPVCTIATGLGVGFFRWLGVDDTIIGLWISGLIISASMWLNKFLIKKGKTIKFQPLLILISFYILSFISLYLMGMFGYSNKLWGFNKLILGIFIGILVAFSGIFLDKFLRKRNGGKVLIIFQHIIILISFLLIFSSVFYFITK